MIFKKKEELDTTKLKMNLKIRHDIWALDLTIKDMLLLSYVISRNERHVILDSYETISANLNIERATMMSIISKLKKIGLINTLKYQQEVSCKCVSDKTINFNNVAMFKKSKKKQYTPKFQDAFYVNIDLIRYFLRDNPDGTQLTARFIFFQLYIFFQLQNPTNSIVYLDLNPKVIKSLMNFFGLERRKLNTCIKFLVEEGDLIKQERKNMYIFNDNSNEKIYLLTGLVK
ncbi:MAG: hypothetical protein ACRC6E_14385 [Fusobacteriaceae bacterium]